MDDKNNGSKFVLCFEIDGPPKCEGVKPSTEKEKVRNAVQKVLLAGIE